MSNDELSELEKESDIAAEYVCYIFGFNFSDMSERQAIRWIDAGFPYIEAWRLVIIDELSRIGKLSNKLLHVFSNSNWPVKCCQLIGRDKA